MEDNAPEGQPLRQPTIAFPKVRVAHVDPCIVYLEVTEASSADKVPALIACWARSSSEVHKVGEKAHLKLNHVFVLMGSALANKGKPQWHFIVHEQEELTVESHTDLSLSIHFQTKPVRGLRGEIRFIDQDTDLSLERLAFDKTRTDHDLAKRILEIASVEWPSLGHAKAFLQQNPLPYVDLHSDKNLSRSQTEVCVHELTSRWRNSLSCAKLRTHVIALPAQSRRPG